MKPYKMDDYGQLSSIALFFLIFMILVGIGASFFNSDASLKEEVVEDEGVFKPVFVNDSAPTYNESTGEWYESTGEKAETNYVMLGIGILAIVGAIAATFFTLGAAGPITLPVAGGIFVSAIGGTVLTLSSSPGGRALMHGSIVGNLTSGLSYIWTSLYSFGKLIFWENAIIDSLPFMRAVFIIPVVFIFFYLTITLVRGGGGH